MLGVFKTALLFAMVPLSAGAATDISRPFVGAEIVILGELHDNASHHENQASIVKKLQPDALVFEMIEPKHALSITPDSKKSASALGELLEWNARGWPDFEMYYPIFAAAPDAAIFGGAASKDAVRRAVRQGASSVFGEASAAFGVDQAIDETQLLRRMQLQQDAH